MPASNRSRRGEVRHCFAVPLAPRRAVCGAVRARAGQDLTVLSGDTAIMQSIRGGRQPMQARAAVMPERHGRWTLETVEVAEPGPQEVLVRVVASGICQTDVYGEC